MREFLVSIFGEWGATIAQFLLTVAIVLTLIGIAMALVRRYSGVRIGGIGRGRVPRLAVVDEMPVDRRRRLVLVRRDNVEHLLLIGGPGDVVIETSIQRVRQRPPQQAGQPAPQQATTARPSAQAAAEAPAPAPAEPPPDPRPAANELIPFPAARGGWVRPASDNERPALRRVERRPPEPPPVPAEPEAPVAAFAPPPEPPAPAPRPIPQRQPAAAVAPAPPPEPASEPLLPELVTDEVEEPAPPAPPVPAYAEVEIDETQQTTFDLGDIEAPATAAEEEPPQSPDEAAARVSDLEREMARLLDEITSRRTS
jgi:flagellar protein FliO/FliZ